MRNRPSEDNPNGTGDSFNGKGKHFEEVESVRQKIIMDFEETMESFHSQDVELKSQCKKAALWLLTRSHDGEKKFNVWTIGHWEAN